MKYFMLILLVGAKLNSCETCLENMEQEIEIIKYYNKFAENDGWKTYTSGVLNGLEISSRIYHLNHGD